MHFDLAKLRGRERILLLVIEHQGADERRNQARYGDAAVVAFRGSSLRRALHSNDRIRVSIETRLDGSSDGGRIHVRDKPTKAANNDKPSSGHRSKQGIQRS